METPEIKLRCLELAMNQARAEGAHGNIDRVAEIQKRFYTLITEGSKPETETDRAQAKRHPKTDKAPEIFK